MGFVYRFRGSFNSHHGKEHGSIHVVVDCSSESYSTSSLRGNRKSIYFYFCLNFLFIFLSYSILELQLLLSSLLSPSLPSSPPPSLSKEQDSQRHQLNSVQQDTLRPGTNIHVKAGQSKPVGKNWVIKKVKESETPSSPMFKCPSQNNKPMTITYM